MSLWVVAALLSPLFYSLANLTDKFLLEKRIANFYAYGVLMGGITLAVATILLGIVGFSQVPMNVLAIGIVGGVAWGIGGLVWYSILPHTEISRAMGIFYTYPIGVLILSKVMLGEQLTLLQHGGVLLLVSGALILAAEPHASGWRFTPAFFRILLIALLFAIIETIQKYLLQYMGFLQAYAIIAVPLGLTVLLPAFSRSVRHATRKAASSLPGVLLSISFGILGTAAFLFAASHVPVAVVSAIGVLQPLFVFLLMLGLSTFLPHILRESVGRRATLTKAVGMCCAVIGTLVLIT